MKKNRNKKKKKDEEGVQSIYMCGWKPHMQGRFKLCCSPCSCINTVSPLERRSETSVCALDVHACVCMSLQICIYTYISVCVCVCVSVSASVCVSLPGSSVLTHFTVISEGIITDGG